MFSFYSFIGNFETIHNWNVIVLIINIVNSGLYVNYFENIKVKGLPQFTWVRYIS